MSLYNIIYGEVAESDIFLEMIGLTRNAFYRYRDVYASVEDDVPVIIVLTRAGGGNRYCIEDIGDNGYPADKCCDCGSNEDPYMCAPKFYHLIKQHELYLVNRDDDFDYTYAEIVFKVPEEYADFITAYVEEKGKPKSLLEKTMDFQKGLASMSREEIKERYPAMVDLIEQISKKIKEAG